MTRRVLITRASADAGPLVASITALGLSVVCVPLIERRPLPRPHWEHRAEWLFLTSPATVAMLDEAPSHRLIAAVGSATADAATARGWTVTVVGEGTGKSLVAQLGELTGQRVAYPAARHATPETAAALRAAGAVVEQHPVYDNVLPAGAAEQLRALGPTWATALLSASAARRLATHWPEAASTRLIAIGPSTAEAAERAGLMVSRVAETPTLAGIVDALSRELATSGPA